MFILIVYDIETTTKAGIKRLNKIAKYCENIGCRVQDSVFEAKIDYGNYIKIKNELENIIDINLDSIRIYNLGKNYENKIEIIGNDNKIEFTKDFII